MYRVRTEDKRWHTAVYSELDQKLDATGFHRTYYKGKLVDCDYGPAIVGEDGEYEYVYRGLPITKDDLGELRHIDMKFEDVGDKPSVVFRCRKTKAIHRVHGPAIIQSGCRYFAWYQNGRLHRVNGFAEEFTVNGRTRKRRVVDGRLSGWGEPAVVAAPRKEYWSYGRKILKKDLLKSEVAADYNYECYIVAYNAFKRSVDTGDHTAVIDLFARLEDGSLSRKAMALGAYHAYVFTDEEPLSRDGDEFEDVMNSYLDSDASIYIMDKFSSGGRTDYLLYLVACYISKLDASAVFTSTQNEGLPRAAQLASGDILFENEVRTAIEFYHALDPLVAT